MAARTMSAMVNGCEVAKECVFDPRCPEFEADCKHHVDAPQPADPAEVLYGPIETAVRAEIDRLAERASRPGKLVLAAMAVKLSRVLDVRGDDEPASQTAKAVDTLRITMGQLLQGDRHDPDEQRKLEHILGSPSSGGSPVSAEVRYPKKPRADDPGSGGGEDRAGDGQAPDAPPAVPMGRSAGD